MILTGIFWCCLSEAILPVLSELCSCKAHHNPSVWQDKGGRNVNTPSSSSLFPVPLCYGHGTLLEWLVGSLRRDIWRLNVTFKAWRWQGTPQTGLIPVYTQGLPQGYTWKQESIYLLSKLKYLGGVALLFLSRHYSSMRRKTLSTFLSVDNNVISKSKNCRHFYTGFLFHENNFL